MDKFLKEVRELAYKEALETGTPPEQLVKFTTEIGIKIAKDLKANVSIVEASTLLMDISLGRALKENKREKHIEMSLEVAENIFSKHSLSESEKENIRHSILEHHGVKKFYSLESEICCNADCYKFASLKGFLLAFRYTRDMELEDLISLLENKVEEKWNVISFSFVKEDLSTQYKHIKDMLNKLKNS